MSLKINYNLSSLLAYQNLRNVDRLMQDSIARLSSGVRIQRAGDDPASMVLSQQLRHHLAGVKQATQNNEEGVTMVQTAEGAMDQVSQLLIRMRTLAVQAANDGAQNPASLQALQNDLDAAVASVTQIANHTSFGTLPLLQGALSNNTLATASRTTVNAITHDMTQLPGGIQNNSALTATVAAPTTLSRSNATVTLTGLVSPLPGTTPIFNLQQNGTALDDVVGKNITITGPLGNRTITLAAGTTINDVVSQVNAYTTQTGVRATYDANTGALAMESTTFGNGTFAITSDDMTTGLVGVGLFDDDTATVANGTVTPATNQTLQFSYVDSAGTTQTLVLTQDPTSTNGLTFTNLAGGPELVAPFTAFRPGAFSVSFVDTSNGTFGSTVTIPTGTYTATRTSTTFIQTGAQANQTTLLDIPDMRAGALAHSAGLAATGYASLADLTTNSALTAGDADTAILMLDAAIKEVTEARGRAGAIQANALETSMESLRISFENLTSAESRLRDTDFAAESAAYARHNIIYQAATSMLAQANQVPQTILQMLRS